MTAEQLLKDARLDEAIEKLNGEVCDDPTDARRRTFLFELLCFAGEYSRAEKQLDILAQVGPQEELGALLYKGALAAERVRQEMFDSRTYPQPSGDPVAFVVNGLACASLSDADPRIGANLEIISAGRYVWMRLDMIKRIEIQPPKRLRDLLWLPASIHTVKPFEGSELHSILIPVLYPGSAKSSDSNVRLGRVTSWLEDGSGVVPIGQKLLISDGTEWPLLDLRELRTEVAAATAS